MAEFEWLLPSFNTHIPYAAFVGTASKNRNMGVGAVVRKKMRFPQGRGGFIRAKQNGRNILSSVSYRSKVNSAYEA